MNTNPIQILLQRLLITKDMLIKILKENNIEKSVIEKVEEIFYQDYGL